MAAFFCFSLLRISLLIFKLKCSNLNIQTSKFPPKSKRAKTPHPPQKILALSFSFYLFLIILIKKSYSADIDHALIFPGCWLFYLSILFISYLIISYSLSLCFLFSCFLFPVFIFLFLISYFLVFYFIILISQFFIFLFLIIYLISLYCLNYLITAI